MEIYTSYFYQLRFFPANAVAISTAIWDPQWFHNFKNQSYVFKDKRGIYNGIRCSYLQPGPQLEGLCYGKNNCIDAPGSCRFLKAYRQQLDQIDFNEFMIKLQRVVANTGIENPIVIFLVHEAKDNPCSERKPIQEWFASHGIKVKEWLPN